MNGNASDIVQEITQSVLAVVTLAGALVVAILLVQRGAGTGDIPAWLALGVGAVLGFYFGARGSNSTIATLTNGPMHLLADAAQRKGGRATDTTTPAAPEDSSSQPQTSPSQ